MRAHVPLEVGLVQAVDRDHQHVSDRVRRRAPVQVGPALAPRMRRLSAEEPADPEQHERRHRHHRER
ncbi:MAG: hypothetical protein ACR2LV_07190 [Solirubrobacteraceae bacterium]